MLRFEERKIRWTGPVAFIGIRWLGEQAKEQTYE
jgi:hypothetical protein